MTFKYKSNSKNKHKKSSKGSSAAPAKFLYQRQENRKKQIKDEEDLWESVSESEDDQESEESFNNQEKAENSVSAAREEEEDNSNENSDSDSENEIFKSDNEENLLNLNSDENINKNMDQIKISNEEKEKINALFLDSIENCRDVKKKIDFTTDFIKNPNNETKFGLSFLDSKNGLMIMYESYMLLYSMMKLSGVKIEKNLAVKEFDFNKDQNVLKNLITCRTFLEKIKSIDIKLKSQVDRFMKLSEQDADDENNFEGENEDEEANAVAMRVINLLF